MKRFLAVLLLLALAFAGAANATVFDSCDINGDKVVDAADAQFVVLMALGILPCTASINGPGICNAITLQRVVNDINGVYDSGGCPLSNGSHSVLLSWIASSSDDGGTTCCAYNVYRSTTFSGTYELAATHVSLSNIGAPSGNGYEGYLDTTVVIVPGNVYVYYYYLTAVSTSGVESGPSGIVQANIPAP